MTRSTSLLLATLISVVAAQHSAVAQSDPAPFSIHQASSGVTYQYPLPNAKEVVTETQIGIRIGEVIRASEGAVEFSVIGSLSGVHSGTVRYARTGTMAIFTPATPFARGEAVEVRFAATTISGKPVWDNFSFTVTTLSPERANAGLRLAQNRERDEIAEYAKSQPLDDTMTNVPAMHVVVDEAKTQGDIYIANFGFAPVPNGDFLFILNEHGAIQKQHLLPQSHGLDFKRQRSGVWTYFDGLAEKYYSIDSNFAILDSFAVERGYTTDGHDLMLLPNGGYLILGVQQTATNMAEIYANGKADASLTTNVLQEFDRDRNVIFQWRGIDYLNVLDAKHEDLTKSFIDFQHANAIDIDLDGNIIMSNRHLSEVIKIDRNSGEIKWRLGGEHNSFTFVNDTTGISYQHAARILPNGHLTLFDNGNFHAVKESRAVEYVLDTVAMTATQVWDFHHTPPVYGLALGYVQRLADGSSLICWGANATTVTEVRPDNTVDFELAMGNGNYSYRAFKYSDLPAGVAAYGAGSVLLSAFPNPATISSSVVLTVAQPGNCRVTLLDVTGRIVETLYSGRWSAGEHEVSIDTRSLPSGAYRVRVESPDGVASTSMVVVR